MRMLCETGAPPRILAGWSGPLLTAGPVRHAGLAQMLSDPCADAYLFDGAWHKPVALDFDSKRRGFFLGDAAGFWALDAEAPRLGAWAGRVGDGGALFGCAAACSVLPARERLDAWFSSEPLVPRRLCAAGLVWAGWGWPSGKILAAAARSEEDLGGQGWSARAEAEGDAGALRWSGRVSGASPGWRGLGGQEADRWEVRTDVSWLLPSRTRLEGRFRTGVTEDGIPDWEALARAAWTGKAWNLGAEAQASDSPESPFLKLEGGIGAGYETGSMRTSVWASWAREGGAPSRAELSGSLALGGTGRPRLRLEGAGRRTAEGAQWKAGLCLDLPSATGSYTVRFASGDWTEITEEPRWEAEFFLRARFP